MFISKCCAEFGTLTDKDLAEAELIVQLFNDQWRQLFDTVPPKVHTWDHMLEDLRLTRGMKYHQEGFIELMHQEGQRMKRRCGGVRGGVMKILNAERQAAADRQDAKAKIHAVEKKSKRKMLKRSKSSLQKEKERQDRLEKQAELLKEPTIKFKTLVQLVLDDRKEDLEAQALDDEWEDR